MKSHRKDRVSSQKNIYRSLIMVFLLLILIFKDSHLRMCSQTPWASLLSFGLSSFRALHEDFLSAVQATN